MGERKRAKAKEIERERRVGETRIEKYLPDKYIGKRLLDEIGLIQ